MSNQYTATPSPPKEDLEFLYNLGLTQSEIGYMYNVSQKIVWKWFVKNNIQSRIPTNRYQNGDNNPNWVGDKAKVDTLHRRLEALHGKPKGCSICGITDKNKKYDWANLTGNYSDLTDYKRMCRSCHSKYDKKVLNINKMRRFNQC